MERQREYANALYNQKLYVQAVSEYIHLLEWYKLDTNLRANITYTVGNIYFDQLEDYRSALSFFLKIKYLFRESALVEDANKRIIACLERLGRSVDAAAVLRETTALTESSSLFERLPGDTVAIIAERVLTSGDLDRLFSYYFNSLPPEQRSEEPTRDEKLAFLRDYIKSEVLYNSALRQNLDQKRDVIEVAYLQKKNLIIDKLLEIEVYNKVTVENSEIERYYQENKDKLTARTPDGKLKKLSLQEARDVIYRLLFMQKAKKLNDELTDRLIEAQNARIYYR